MAILAGVLVAGGLASGCTGSTAPQVERPVTSPTVTSPAGSNCLITPVQSGPLPAGFVGGGETPRFERWVSSANLVGVLFYSRDGTSTIGLDGKMPDGGNTKILWFVREATVGPILIQGDSDRGGRFEASFEGAGSYPSIVEVPSAGCWTLRASLGAREVGTVAVVAR